MNLPHLHLLLNHFPTVGTIIALGLFLFALLRKSDELKRASLVLFLGIGLLTIPVYMTGNAALLVTCKAPPGGPCVDYGGMSKNTVEAHETAALIAFAVMQLTAIFAWFGLWQYRRTARFSSAAMGAVLIASIVTFGLMAQAANIGGEIRHPEIRSGPESTQEVETLARAIGAALAGGTPWAWPASETFHFIGLSLLFGVVLLVDLRMMGFLKNIPFSALHRLMPWAVLGFALNTATGMLFYIASPWQYAKEAIFHWKIILILLAGANAMYFTLFDEPWKVGADDTPPTSSRLFAASAIVLWIAVIYCGHMLPFIGNAF